MADNEVKQLSQEIKEMREETNSRLSDIDINLAGLTKTVEETMEVKYEEHERRISLLEKNQRWVVLGVLTAVMGALLGLVLV